MMNSYIEEILKKEKEKNPNQKEYIQALEEVLSSISIIFDNHPDYQEKKILERLVEPDRIIRFKVSLTRDDGTKEEYDGYRVQHNNVVGVYKGGLRFNTNVNESILKFLAFEQMFKNALTTLPMGGAKGGSNFNPKDKSEEEIKRFCFEFMKNLAPHIGEGLDVPAGDLGVGARELNYLFDAYKEIKKNEELGFITGKPIEKGGSLARKEATGYGLIYFVEEILKLHPIKNPRVIVSGSGNVALYAATKAKELGYKVIGMSDSKGYVIDEDLDIGLIKQTKEINRLSLKEYPKGEYHEGSIYDHEIDVDIVLPCATQNEIDLERAKRLVRNGVKIVAEGANMPNDNEAIKYYKDNKIIFVPGKASNAGGVSVSYLEMEQNRLKEKWTFEEVDNKLKNIMKSIHAQCLDAIKEYNLESFDYVTAANLASATKIINILLKKK